jgi:SpoVK/Ycf46/Vps4 family AAA+-type ATPase
VEKPLYPITCGDLGSTAEDVEWNLKKHFTLASKWDCVMLLDEADVFLAKRRQADLQRNSIVSVFLRMLEYYKGLLFLTTNRVGTFDEAFKSRVHISLFCKFTQQDGPFTVVLTGYHSAS